MRVFISGQKSFGAGVLQLVQNLTSNDVVGVSCPREDSSGRPDKLYAAALAHDIPSIDSKQLRASDIPAGTDLIVCAHSHAFIGERTRSAARLGAIGYHPSLLPRHRGRDAIKWAIRMNEPITGGTVYWLTNRIDAGDIAAQEWCWIEPGTDASELWRKHLFPLGLVLIDRTLRDIESGRIVRVRQNEAVATWEPALDPPRLYRPELPQLCEKNNGFRYQVESDLQMEIARFA